MTSEPSDKSFVKAFVCFLFGATLMAALLASLIADLDPYNAGRALGRIVATALIPAVIVGWLSKRSEREYGWLKFGLLYAVFFVGCSVLQGVGSAARKTEERVMTEAEGAAPVVTGQDVCHSGVPFQLLLTSSSFTPKPELGQEGPDMRMWVWEDSNTGERVLVQTVKGATKSPSDFEQFIEGIKSSAGEANELLADNVDASSAPYSADLSFLLQNGASLDQRCLSHGDSQRPSWIVCVTTIAADSQSLQSIRDSVQLASC